jgi:hypothetical protein
MDKRTNIPLDVKKIAFRLFHIVWRIRAVRFQRIAVERRCFASLGVHWHTNIRMVLGKQGSLGAY